MQAISPFANWRAILHFAGVLRKHRELTWEMTKREFTERYAGQAFGYIWAFVHPISLIMVYIFVFTVVFRVRLEAAGMNYPGDFTCYLLAGLIPWLATQDALNRGSQVIVANRSLVKQVMFPLEVLPTNCVFAIVLTEIILLCGYFAYTGIRLQWIPATAFLVPLLVAIQAMGLLGLSLIFSGVGAVFRDSKDFIQVFCAVNLYFMPVVYLPAWVPGVLRPLIYLNPFSYQTWCFQDALFFGSIEHPWAWVFYFCFNFLLLGLGYRSFRHMRHFFGNIL